MAKKGRPIKDKKDSKSPPYSKQVVLNAIKSGSGFFSYVGKYLHCSGATAKKYINKWEETKELFLISQIPLNNLALESFVEALQDGEQWAIDRILARIPEEGLSPNKPKNQHDKNDGNVIKSFKIVEYSDDE